MKDQSKTKQVLIQELVSLRQMISDLEQSESWRQQAEEALRESEEKFRKLADATWEGIIIHSEGIVMDANKSASKMIGYPAEELIGRSVLEFLAPESIEPALQKLREGATQDQLHLEVKILRKDKTIITAEALGRPIRYNNIDARVLAFRDITERKRAELREKLAREVLELLNHPADSTDIVRDILQVLKKNADFEAVGVRLREGDDFPYYETYGFSDDFIQAERYLCARDEDGKIIRDRQGKPLLECMCGNILLNQTDPALPFFTEGGSFWSNCTTDLLASTTEKDRQARTRNRCNSEGYESVAVIPLRSGDEIIGLLQINDRRRNQLTAEMIWFFEGLGVSIGIALSRKQAKMDLAERTKQHETANKELESFSYSVAHDLRAPLRAIDGYARMILKKQGDKFDKDILDKFGVIRSNAILMGQLIDDLLALSRLGRKHISLTSLDMDALVRDVWKEMQNMNPGRNMVLTVNSIPPGYGDRALIKQLYINLLSNAVKFTKNRDTAHIEAGGYSDGNEVVYYVRDNGVGFDMQYYDKLFGVFQRLHSADDFEGTGVGLAIVERIVHRHGGRVWAEGKIDQGACLYFKLG